MFRPAICPCPSPAVCEAWCVRIAFRAHRTARRRILASRISVRPGRVAVGALGMKPRRGAALADHRAARLWRPSVKHRRKSPRSEPLGARGELFERIVSWSASTCTWPRVPSFSRNSATVSAWSALTLALRWRCAVSHRAARRSLPPPGLPLLHVVHAQVRTKAALQFSQSAVLKTLKDGFRPRVGESVAVAF